MKKGLTIAGSDCSGGAGIQADLKTFQERDIYGMSVLTCLVAMTPEEWRHIVRPVELEMIRHQFRTAYPGVNGIDAVKTGMLPTVEIIETVGELLGEVHPAHLVIDPVMVCKGTKEPLFPENTQAMIHSLLPLAEVVTPNTFEALQLSGLPDFQGEDDLLEAARRICALGPKYTVIKAARIFDGRSVDLLYDGREPFWIREEKITTAWTHGAGCSFSACLTAELAKDAPVREAFLTAHAFVHQGLLHSFPLNDHVGPIYHKAYAKYGA